MTTITYKDGNGATQTAPASATGAPYAAIETNGAPVAASNPLWTEVPPVAYQASSNFTTAPSSSVAVTAGLYANSLTLQNNDASIGIWINPGSGAAAVGQGYKLYPGGGSITFGDAALPVPTGSIKVIAESGTPVLSIMGS